MISTAFDSEIYISETRKFAISMDAISNILMLSWNQFTYKSEYSIREAIVLSIKAVGSITQ